MVTSVPTTMEEPLSLIKHSTTVEVAGFRVSWCNVVSSCDLLGVTGCSTNSTELPSIVFLEPVR